MKLKRANLHKFLMQGFTAPEILDICMLHFPEVYARLSPGNTNDQIVRLLLPQLESKGQIPELLEVLKEANPYRYEEFGPYYEGQVQASAPQSQAYTRASSGGQSQNNQSALRKTIIFIAANPKDAPLRLEREYRDILREFNEGAKRDLYEWKSPSLATTSREFMRILSQEPNLIHFAGHGGTDGLYLLDQAEYSKLIPSEVLELLFEDLKGKVECILLNACYSANQAQMMSQTGAYVIGYNLPIGDEAATTFAKSFYAALGEGKDYLAAAKKGKAMLMLEHNRSELLLEIWKDGQKLIG